MKLAIELENFEHVIEKVRNLPKDLKVARIDSLNITGQGIVQDMKRFIESSGDGAWKKPHPLTLEFERKSQGWQKNDRKGNFFELGDFARCSVGKDGNYLITGFGNFEKTSKTPSKFDPKLMKYASGMRGKTISVTDSMRRKLGATKMGRQGIPGKSYFPIRKTTGSVTIPSRLIRYNTKKIMDVFTSQLEKSFDKRNP